MMLRDAQQRIGWHILSICLLERLSTRRQQGTYHLGVVQEEVLC